MSFSKGNDPRDRVLEGVAVLNSLSVLFVLAIYAYGGFFARYLADDYCETAWLSSTKNVFAAMMEAYASWLNSYSVLLFVQLSDWGGLWGFKLMPGATIVFWIITSTWLMYEIGRVLALKRSMAISLWLAALAIFLSLYQTPALYQILYWRTGLIPYTIPLGFFTGLAAFILWYARQPLDQARSVRMRWIVSVLIIFVTGLCETTSALLVGILFLAVILTWLTRAKHQRPDVLIILLLALFWAVVCLLIIALSPGTSSRLDRIMTNPPLYNPITLGVQVVIYTAQFLWDNLKVTPLPMIIAVTIPFGVMFVQSSDAFPFRFSNRQILIAVAVLFVLMFIAIGFSFAPSAFVRTYPVARARFASHFVMNFCLILAGGLLGVLASQFRLSINTAAIKWSALVLLGVMSLYPLYVSTKVQAAMPEYKSFASAWDQRDAVIQSAVTNGETDLVVTQLDSIGGVGEYKEDPNHWINRCAARYYRVNSVVGLLP